MTKKEFVNFPGEEIDITEEGNFTELVVENCPNLLLLEANNCGLKKLTIKDCPKLYKLSVYSNKFRRLDFNDLPSLEYLNVGFNILALLDIQNCPKLETLYCNRNNYSELDFSHLTNLKSLYCHDNKWLKKLNVSGLKKLTKLFCQECQLSTIDLKDCSNLIALDIAENRLEKIDNLKDARNLTNFSCRFNKISELDLSGCRHPEDIYIFGTKIYDLDLSKLVIYNKEVIIIYSSQLDYKQHSLFFPDLAKGFLRGEAEALELGRLKNLTLNNSTDFIKVTLPNKMVVLYLHKNQTSEVIHNLWEVPEPPLTEEQKSQLVDIMRDEGRKGIIKFLKPVFNKHKSIEEKSKNDEGYETGEEHQEEEHNIFTLTYNPPRKKLLFNVDLSHWKLTGRLIIEDWPKLRTLNVGNNQLQDLIVRNCPNLKKLIYAHNEMKKTATIENCPKLVEINKENYHGKNKDWRQQMSEEDKAYQQERVEQMKLIEEINDEVVALLEKEKQGKAITLEEVVKLLNKIKYKDQVLPEYRKPFADLCDRILKTNFPKTPPPKQSPPPKEKEEPDYKKLYHDLLVEVEKLRNRQGKSTPLTPEQIKEKVAEIRKKINDSALDENKKQELLKQLEKLSNQNKTTDNSAESPSSSYNYDLVWIPVLIGQAILLSALVYGYWCDWKKAVRKGKI